MKYCKSFLVLVILSFGLQLNAQIGYQVSLLNSATGEPRANETVSVQVEITNSENTVICSETKSATTNEFGVLSLQIGNASTFQNVDWSKLPLFVSATVDGIMIGKSQILNVPVAEAAKTLVNVDPSLICRTWSKTNIDDHGSTISSLTLNADYTFYFSAEYHNNSDGNVEYAYSASGRYFIMENVILLTPETGDNVIWYYLPTYMVYENNVLYGGGNTAYVNLVFY